MTIQGPGPEGLQRIIFSIHELKPVKNWRSCDPRRQHRSTAELIGWLATIPSSSDDCLQATIVIPDDTRPLRPTTILPPLLGAISEAASRRGAPVKVTVLVATGLHQNPGPPFREELQRALEPFAGHTMLSTDVQFHDAQTTERLQRTLNPLVTRPQSGGQADCVITVGLVEPHQYAGFSGGSKALTIGCGASSTIASLHSLQMLRKPGVTIGEVSRNPFRKELDRVARQHAAPTFELCLVPNPDGKGIAGFYAGPPGRPYKSAVHLARQLLMAPLGRQFDFALISVPDAKSQNFYQASRALTYLALHPNPCIRPKGTLVLQAQCPDAYGTSAGEEAFRRALGRGRRRLLAELQGKAEPPPGLTGGAQRAYVLAVALTRFRCVLIGAPPLPEAQRAGLKQYDSIEDVMLAGDGLIVDDPFVMMPYHDEAGASVDRLVTLSDRPAQRTA